MNPSKLVILMLGGARRVSLAELLKESGHRIGREVEIISYELMKQVPIAAVGKVEIGLRWDEPDVEEDIVRLVYKYSVNIILPFVDGAIEIAARCKNRLKDVFIPVSDFEVARMMFDKIDAARAFKDASLPIPRTYTPINATVPAIAKPRHGSASRGIKIFNNLEDLMQLENLPSYLVQEYIPNREEYTADCYITAKGEILCTVPRIRLEVMGGEVTRTRTARIECLIEMCHHVINAFSLRGPVTLQFIHDLDSDRYLLMEVNPRLGGGVICSIGAGAPINDYILREALGMTLEKCDSWRDNSLMVRYWKEVFFDYAEINS